jgi:hypothetical protein
VSFFNPPSHWRVSFASIQKPLPTTIKLNGQAPEAYIISSNLNRRHMTKGQRAMAVAMINPDPAKGGRGKINSVNT